MVCGKREIDIEYLKANTVYRAPVRPTDSHVHVCYSILFFACFSLSFLLSFIADALERIGGI